MKFEVNMEKHKMKLISIAVFSFFLASCNNTSTKNIANNGPDSISKSNSEKKELIVKLKTGSEIKTDSLELTTLIRNLYKWHETERRENNYSRPDFPTTEKDSIFTGIDWKAHNERMSALKKTNFFSKEFFTNYNKIAVQIDSFIKIDKTKNNYIPPFDTDGDDWCGCQWSPDNYWETITITNLRIFKDSASFKWNWTPSRTDLYYVKTIKENNKWKIAYLEGFRSRDYLFKEYSK